MTALLLAAVGGTRWETGAVRESKVSVFRSRLAVWLSRIGMDYDAGEKC